MKKLFIVPLLFAILLATGCGPSVYQQIQNIDYSEAEKQCKNLEGKPVEAVYKLWGSPKEVSHTGKYKVLKYVDYQSFKGWLIIAKRDVFVKDGIIEICDFRHSARK